MEDITIRNLKYVTGINLAGSGARQQDGMQVRNCLIAGGQNTSTWSNTGNWQQGIVWGNGTFANNYNHIAEAVSCSGHYNNYVIATSGVLINGGEPANGFVDFNIVPGAQCAIRGIQTQNCNQFFSIQGFSPLPITFDDCLIKSNFINASGWVGTIIGGQVILRNMSFAQCQIVSSGVYGNCLLHITNDSSAQRYPTIAIENLCAFGVKPACIVPTVATGAANIVCSNYMNYSNATGLYTLAAGDILSTWSSGAAVWNTIV